MAINVSAAKRGWLYDKANAKLQLYVNGVAVMDFTSTGATNNLVGTYTGVQTFTGQDVHSGGLTVASSKPVVLGTASIPKISTVTKTSGAGYTMTAAELLSGFVSDTTATGAIAVTLPTVAAVVAVLPGYVVGSSFQLVYKNLGNQTATITTDAGSQWTIVDTATITTTKQSIFLFTITSATAGLCRCLSANVAY